MHGTPLSPLVVWSALPVAIRNALLRGGDGKSRLLFLTENFLPEIRGPQAEVLTKVFADMALCTWESAFFDVQAASVLQQVQSQLNFMQPKAAAFVECCAAARPGSITSAQALDSYFQAGNISAVKELLLGLTKSEPGNLFWVGFARHLGLQLDEKDWFYAYLAQSSSLPAFVQVECAADLAFAREDWPAAVQGYAAAYSLLGLPGLLVKQAEALCRLGQRDEALALWGKVITVRPWQINLLLRASDVMLNRDLPGAPPSGKGQVLLYSWNHALDLDATMASLAASELGDCGLIVLDNGSIDETPDILRQWQERFGERLKVITLPVNIGAPAARNWLLSLPEVRDAAWVAFLDDDAVVPPDWLGYFGTALKTYPEARVIGCRIVDQAAPMSMQSVDLHFESLSKREQAGFDVLNAHASEPDFFQYAYLRPCVSVTGCCHLLTRASLDEIGIFDLRFSPSQFDDFERDLRSVLGGCLPLYQGHLCVRHKKRSGVMAGITAWQQANIDGNLKKLSSSYGPTQLNDINAKDDEALWSDLLTRLAVLGKGGGVAPL